MNILEQIIASKRKEIAQHKRLVSRRELETHSNFNRECISLSERLKAEDFGLIAEIKRKSPSMGEINPSVNPSQLAKTYASAGVAGISVLTDNPYFGGSLADLKNVRSAVNIPLLRKDFIVDEYQLFEAKAYGADAVLLIAEALDKQHLMELALIANSLDMEVLMELHSLDQLDKYNEEIAILGVNNRNLKTQVTAIKTSIDLYPYLPRNVVKITESGISSAKELYELNKIGYQGALVGTSIVGNEDPAKKIMTLKTQIEYNHEV